MVSVFSIRIPASLYKHDAASAHLQRVVSPLLLGVLGPGLQLAVVLLGMHHRGVHGVQRGAQLRPRVSGRGRGDIAEAALDSAEPSLLEGVVDLATVTQGIRCKLTFSKNFQY